MDNNKDNNINTDTKQQESIEASQSEGNSKKKPEISDANAPKDSVRTKGGAGHKSKADKSSGKAKKPGKGGTKLKVVQKYPQKSHKSKKSAPKTINVSKRAIIAAAFVILVGAILFISRNSVVKIGEKQVMFSQEYTMNSKADFRVCGDNIYYVSKDGMILLNKKGETVWTDTFTMTSPVMLRDGEFCAVADNKSKTVNVYDLTGKLYSVTAGGDITTLAVNPIGCCAVVCKADDDYKIDVYSEAGEQMFEGSYAAKDGIPLAIDISDDGKLLAVSLVSINEINMRSNVLFYYTTKTEAKNTESSDGMISAINCNEDMAGVIRFLPDNSCIVATDKKIMNIGKKNSDPYLQNWEIPYTNYVTAMDIVDNKYIALAYGEPISAGDEAKPVNSVYWYNLKGKEVGKAQCDERITGISSSLESSIIYMGKNFKAFTVGGRELWSYTALQNVESIQFYNTQDTIVLATATKMNLLDVKKGAEMEEEVSPDIVDIADKEDNNSNESGDKTEKEDTKETTEAVTDNSQNKDTTEKNGEITT